MIVLATPSFIYLSVPFAISVAATVRITYLLKGKKHNQARTAAILALLECIVVSGAMALLLYFLRPFVGYVFSSDANIIYRIKELMLYASCFSLAYGVAGGAQGVLRATSHQWDIFFFTFLALWLVALLLGAFLAFVVRPTYELRGIWLGLLVGMSLLAATLLLQVLCLDWQKEARKISYRSRRTIGLQQSHSEDRTSAGRRRQRAAAGRDEETSSGSSSTSSGSTHLTGVNEADSSTIGLQTTTDDTGVELTVLTPRHRAEDGTGTLRMDSNAAQESSHSAERVTFNLLLLSSLEVGMPALGSRAIGGLPVSLWQSADEEMAELEHIEFGGSRASNRRNRK